MTSTAQPSASRRQLARTVVVAFVALNLFTTDQAQAGDLDTASRVLGYQECIDCHELPAEAWMRSGHAQRSLAMLTSNLRASRYARRLNIAPSELANNSVCTDCHGTRQRNAEGILQVAHGVSCESCHGPAGSSSTSIGWYELHSGEVTHPKNSSADLAAALRDAGLAGTDDLYSIAVRCYSCHSVSNEAVVRAGHVAGTADFELTTWFSGEVRHNFAPHTVDVEDDERNTVASNLWLAKHKGTNPNARRKLMYVAGQLADLEVNLRNRADATEAGSFATSAASRSAAALARLQQIAARLEAEELLSAVAAAESVGPLLFLTPEESQRRLISIAADGVARAARKFVANHDGLPLDAIDAILPSETKGEAYQP